MRYRIRDGIVMAKICDEYLLISGKEARDLCPSVTQINETAAYIWEKIESGCSAEEIIDQISKEYETDEDIGSMVNDYVNLLAQNGYLISEGE